jgi:hypothetical protein
VTTITSLPDLLTLYRNDPRVARIAEGLQPDSARVQIAGTIGSSQALIAASVIDRMKGVHVFVLTDKEKRRTSSMTWRPCAAYLGQVDQPGNLPPTASTTTCFFYPAPSRSAYDSEGHHDGERVSGRKSSRC